jgi:hypothetical protein
MSMTINSLIHRGYRCKKCFTEDVSRGGPKHIKTQAKTRTFYDTKSFGALVEQDGYKLLTEYCGTKSYVTLKCAEPLHPEYKVVPGAFIHKGHRCPECALAKRRGLSEAYQATKLERSRYKSKKWSTDVRRAHGNACQYCRSANKKLVAHHIFSWENAAHLRYEVENGACLCEGCHTHFHNSYGCGNNTLEQFEEWLPKKGESASGVL